MRAGSGVSGRHGRRRGLLAVWALLLVLIAVVLAYGDTALFAPRPVGTAGLAPVIGFDEAAIGSIEALHGGRRASLMRDSRGLWFVHGDGHAHGPDNGGDAALPALQDETHAADPETAARIADLVAAAVDGLGNSCTHEAGARGLHGLDNPKTIFAFYRWTQDGIDYGRPLVMLYVGDESDDGAVRYARRGDAAELCRLPREAIALLLEPMFGAAAEG